jgi:hypothetical protein
VVIALAYKTEDPGFESCQGIRFIGINVYIYILLYLRKIDASKYIKLKALDLHTYNNEK